MASGARKHAADVVVGDILATPGDRAVEVLAHTVQPAAQHVLVRLGTNLWLSPMHRVRTEALGWVEPLACVGAVRELRVCELHNFVVEGQQSIFVENVEVSTIGTQCAGSHDAQWPTQALWGSELIVKLLRQHPAWPNIRFDDEDRFLAVLKSEAFANAYLASPDANARLLLLSHGWRDMERGARHRSPH